MLTTKLNLFDTFVSIATTTITITLSVTWIGLIVISIPTGIASGLTVSNKVLHEIVMQKCKKYKINIRKTIKQLSLLISYIGKLYKIF